MKLHIPSEIDPRFEKLALVSYPQIGSSEQHDGGERAQFISDLVGIPSITVDRPTPLPRIFDLGGLLEKKEDRFEIAIRRAADFAIEQATHDLPTDVRYIHIGNSAGGLAALSVGVNRGDTDGIISLEPTAQVARGKVAMLSRYANQFRVESSKTTEQKTEESLGMPPTRTPMHKLVPKVINELWGHQDIWTTDLSTELILRALGNRALKLFVLYAEKTSLASPAEQQANLDTFQKSYYSPVRKKVFVKPGTYHSSMDKPIYFIEGLSALYPKTRKPLAKTTKD